MKTPLTVLPLGSPGFRSLERQANYDKAVGNLGSWLRHRIDELHMANLEQLSEDIKNGRKLPRGAAISTTESNEHLIK